MSVPYTGPREQLLFQADPHTAERMKTVRDQFHRVCGQHVNRYVRVETIDGEVFEGVIAGCSKGVLYLRQHEGGMTRFTPYSNAILTLVLYELLVITLLL